MIETPPQDPQFVSKLAYQLVRRGIAPQPGVNQVLEEYHRQFEGTSPFAYQVRQADQTIVVVDRSTGEVRRSCRLPLLPNPRQVGWIATSPNYVAIIEAAGGQWQKVVERSGSFGLTLTSGHGLLEFPPGAIPQGMALYQDQWVFEKIPTGDLESGPLDLYVSPREEILVIADRAGGQLHLVEPQAGEILKSLNVRDTRSSKAITVAVSASKPQAFATDQVSSDLILIDFDVRAAQRLSQSHGPLGNLVLSPDDRLLYVLRIDPDQPPAVLVLQTADLAMKATIPIQGHWFSHLDDPCDLIAIAPNNRWLCVASYVNEPSLVTPVLTVIDLEQNQVRDSFVLRKEEKPAALAFLAPQPGRAGKSSLTFGEMLVEKRLVDPVTLRKLTEEVAAQLAEAQKPALEEEVTRLIDDLIPEAQIREEEIAELATPSSREVDRLVAGDGVDWIANTQLDQGERHSFARRVADVKADQQTERANSALVVHLIRPEEEKEPEAPPEYRVPEMEEGSGGRDPGSGG